MNTEILGRALLIANEWHQRLLKVVGKQENTLNVFSDLLNTCQITLHDKAIYIITTCDRLIYMRITDVIHESDDCK